MNEEIANGMAAASTVVPRRVPSMLKHHVMFVGLLASALGVPYAASEWRQILDWVQVPASSSPRVNSAEGIELQRSWEKTNTLVNDTSWRDAPTKSSVFRTVSDSAERAAGEIERAQDRVEQAAQRAIDGYDQAQKATGRDAAPWSAAQRKANRPPARTAKW
ncbi:MAG: hypothetical protein QM811_27540 [Pirellulales bacterium]